MKDKNNKDDRGSLDLSLIIDQHKRDMWKWKMKEAEWIKTSNQLEGTKRIVEELATKNVDLKKEIDRLSEENNNLRTIDSSHKKLNGELQSKIKEVEDEMAILKRDNKYLAQQVEDYREILRKAGL